MKITIHIGMHKTGTTSLQKLLLENENILESYCWRLFVNIPQIVARDESMFDLTWLRSQVRLAENEGIENILFSAEVISTFNESQLSNLVEAFSGHEVILVVCFRNWVSFLPSRWLQNCSRRDTQSFPQYLKNLRQNENNYIEARFDKVVRAMEENCSSELRIISYDNAVSSAGLLPTCISVLGIPATAVAGKLANHRRFAVRKNWIAMEICRLFNGICSMNDGLPPNALFDIVNNGTRFSRMFDQLGIVAKILKDDSQLESELIEIIQRHEIITPLSPADPQFCRWQEQLEQVSTKYLTNPIEGKIFHSVAKTDIVCSEVEVDDLAPALQNKMTAALSEVEGIQQRRFPNLRRHS